MAEVIVTVMRKAQRERVLGIIEKNVLPDLGGAKNRAGRPSFRGLEMAFLALGCAAARGLSGGEKGFHRRAVAAKTAEQIEDGHHRRAESEGGIAIERALQMRERIAFPAVEIADGAIEGRGRIRRSGDGETLSVLVHWRSQKVAAGAASRSSIGSALARFKWSPLWRARLMRRSWRPGSRRRRLFHDGPRAIPGHCRRVGSCPLRPARSAP